MLTSNSGGLAAAKRQRDINRKRLPILVDNLIEGCERIFCPFHPQDHLGPGKRRRRIIVCCFAVVLHIDEEPREVLDLGWEKLDVVLFHALILDIPVAYCTVGLRTQAVWLRAALDFAVRVSATHRAKAWNNA